MRFSKLACVLIPITALYTAGGVRADDCDEGPFTSHANVGFPGKPTHFCDTKWRDGIVVTGMEVWATKYQIKGIKLEWSDTTTSMQGEASGDRHDVIHWNPQDKVTAMKLAVNYKNDGLGLVHIEVAQKTLDVRSDTGKFDGNSYDVASGYLLGHAGDSGGFITNWIPLFMGISTGKAETVDIKFDDNLDDVNQKQMGIRSPVLVQTYIKNSDPANATDAGQSWTFKGEHEVSSSTKLSSTAEQTYGMTETIEIGAELEIPELVKVQTKSSTSFAYQMMTSSSQKLSNGHSTTVGTTQGNAGNTNLLKPGHAKNCSTVAVQGTYNGGYVATVRITVGAKKYDLKRPGTFQGITWVDGVTDCRDMLLTDIPNGANITEARNRQNVVSAFEPSLFVAQAVRDMGETGTCYLLG